MKIASFWAAGDFRSASCLGYKVSLGIKKFGYKIDQHYPRLLDPRQVPEADLVISNGFRDPIPEAARAMKERTGADHILYDLGYIDRSDTSNNKGYYQLSIGHIGWLPDFQCPADRFSNLGKKIVPVVDNKSNTILVCAQKFGDAQHGMGESEMKSLMWDTCVKYKNLGYEVLFRPHPKSPFQLKGFESSKGPLSEVLGRIRFLVTYNSTIGVEALLAGTPVIALDRNVHYKSASSCSWEIESGYLTLPTQEELEGYFHRLAYAQWRTEEISEGYPFCFLLSILKGDDPFSLNIDYTAKQEKVKQRVFEPLCVDKMDWIDARRLVKWKTDISPRNKAHLKELVEAFNSQGV